MLHIYGATDRGMVRETNEDRFAGEVFDQGSGYAVVCDGMGGEVGGGIAAGIAAEEVRRMIESSLRSHMEERSLRLLLETAIAGANRAVYTRSGQSGGALTGMGSTLCAAVISDGVALVANVGDHVSVFMTDYFPRPTKVQGAWMEQLQSAGEYPGGVQKRPIVYNVGNFTPPTSEAPSLLTIDEVETTFHEFGHAMQGMLTRAPYKSLAGTNVDRDYVELCSQINEHWATDPEVMKVYAKHYKTGEPIPVELIEKMKAAGNFGQGFTAAELCAAAMLDMAIAQENGENFDIASFEKAYTDKIGLPSELTYRYRPTYFKHIFGDEGYAAGYYTYLWAQVLEADGWELFQQKGIFDPKTAASFKKNILESGDTEDAMTLFVKFRGHKPDAAALLRLRGLDK